MSQGDLPAGVRGAAQLRVASEDDAGTLSKVGKSTYILHAGSLWGSGLADYLDRQFSEERIAREISGGKSRYVLAENQGCAVGYAKANLRKSIPQTKLAGLEIEKVYLTGEATGSGIGTDLINDALAFAQAHRERTAWLDVLECNTKAARLYERLGFVQLMCATFQTDLRRQPLVIMTKNLDAST